MKLPTELQQLQALCQGVAEELHRETHAPYVVVLLSDASKVNVVGAWVPTKEVLAEILRHAVKSIDHGEAVVVDRTRERS